MVSSSELDKTKCIIVNGMRCSGTAAGAAFDVFDRTQQRLHSHGQSKEALKSGSALTTVFKSNQVHALSTLSATAKCECASRGHDLCAEP